MSEDIKPDSFWRDCDVPGCPLESSVSKEGRKTCTYHVNLFGHEAHQVTNRIKSYLGYVNKYREMVQWSAWDWKNKRSKMISWQELSMGQDEPPSVYLIRYNKWIREKVRDL